MPIVDFAEIGKKWQKKWLDAKLFEAQDKSERPKFYVLEMYAYPSGYAAHVGHARNYVIGDSFARFKRMRGFNVLYPTGWDNFGLPAENDAIERRIHPKDNVSQNIETMKKQFNEWGISYDWNRELASSDPNYYKWTQWLFLKLYEKGKAYKKLSRVIWCPKCKTVLANEQVKEGKCWRCESEVYRKEINQWFFKITDYADRLLEGHEKIEWSENIKLVQKNWIGRSEGIEIFFKVKETNDTISTFTTRSDTIYGVTYMVFAPEHPLIKKLVKGTEYEKELEEFTKKVSKMSDLERTALIKEKNGMPIGKHLINPVNGEEIPIYVADYVIMEYGTGAVMAVPTHDQRDFEFAEKYGLPLRIVIQPKGKTLKEENMEEAFIDEGVMVNSGSFDGMNSREAIEKINDYLEEKGWGKRTVNYKIRDWCISRQRYWGTPIPIIYCEKCGIVPVPEKDLPVELPLDVDFQRIHGEISPLATNKEFVNTKCPKCGMDAKRETDTMDTFVDSSWYFLRYTDPKNNNEIFSKEITNYWTPIDQYIGGAEHTNTHLIYARFITKFLHDLGCVKTDEPFQKLLNQGMVLKGGVKMSKSKHNTIDPHDIIKKYGADSLRTYLLFMAQPDKDIEWSDEELSGVTRFISKVWSLIDKNSEKVKVNGDLSRVEGSKNKFLLSKAHSTLRDVTNLLENLQHNRALLKIMELTNEINRNIDSIDRNEESKAVFGEAFRILLFSLYPFAPFITEEFWEKIGRKEMIAESTWPKFNKGLIDKKAEMGQEVIEVLKSDIFKVIKLTKIKPKKIQIFVAPEWKRKVYTKASKIKNPKELVKKIMEDIEVKKHGKEAVIYANYLGKHAGELKDEILSTPEELNAVEDIKEFLSKEFGAEIEVIDASKSKSSKAKKAVPMKPAIFVE